MILNQSSLSKTSSPQMCLNIAVLWIAKSSHCKQANSTGLLTHQGPINAIKILLEPVSQYPNIWFGKVYKRTQHFKKIKVLLFISFYLLLEREKEAKSSGRCQVTWRGGRGRIRTLELVVSNMCYGLLSTCGCGRPPVALHSRVRLLFSSTCKYPS